MCGRELEEKLLSDFRAQAHLYLDPSLLPSDHALMAWWSLMQHFRAPTRLLDWTASPYVALYFAVEDHWDTPGAVWLFDRSEIALANEGNKGNKGLQLAMDMLQASDDVRSLFWGGLCNLAGQFVYPFGMAKHHTRINTQQGRFTVCAEIPSDHGKVIGLSGGASSHDHCLKIVIGENLKPLFLMNLRHMNISANSLFPGLDGLGRSIEELAKLEAEYADRAAERLEDGNKPLRNVLRDEP
jgi:hypothetical protein